MYVNIAVVWQKVRIRNEQTTYESVRADKNYCEKTQCRRCVFGEKAEMLSDDLDYVGCKLQQNCPCEWKIEEGA